MVRKLIWFNLVLLLVAFLSGCPRFAFIDLYNETSEVLYVSVGSDEIEIKPGTTGRVELTAPNLKVKSKLGSWVYERLIPHGGENGPFFNGTLNAQITQDGKIYALKVEQKTPPYNDVSNQPEGYPIEPMK